MISYDDLNIQSDKITELSNVLTVLIQDRAICDSDTCCTLFYNYMEYVNAHMQNVDLNMYTDLLGDSSSESQNIVDNFMSGSQAIKKIMKDYKNKWCDRKQQKILIGPKHDTFVKETDEMFKMVLDRIQDEMERLYPMVRKIRQEKSQ